MKDTFKQDVIEGLTSTPKRLSSKYFYDEIGDDLFVQIMHMDEYYLTDCEMQIFKEQTTELISQLSIDPNKPFDIIELGAGDGTKTEHLLKKLIDEDYQFTYYPVDISNHALDALTVRLRRDIDSLNVQPLQGDYFSVLFELKETGRQKIILFLGSNIGNFEDNRAAQFLKGVGNFMKDGDRFLVGADLIKAKEIVLPAYSDKKGITAAFNLNLLDRINNSFDGNFKKENFEHLATYEENEGIARSFIVSKINQEISLKKLKLAIHFKEGEKIHVEISRKYNDEIMHQILSQSSLQIKSRILDDKGFFADYILGIKANFSA